ncbi:MAG: hypothetical protein ACSHYB_14575 [Roseibacillus sp.]
MTIKNLIVIASATAILPAQAALVWTGGGNGVSLYAENNWLEDDNTVPETDEVNGATQIALGVSGGLIEINSGSGTPNNAGSAFQFAAGTSLSVGGGKTLNMTAPVSGNNGSIITGWNTANQVLTVDTGGTVRTTGDVRNFTVINVDGGTINAGRAFTGAGARTVSIDVINGGSVVVGSINSSYAIGIDSTSILEITGNTNAANPFNDNAVVNLELGAQLKLSSLSLFEDEGDQIFYNGVSYTEDNSFLSFNGTTATVIPEPTSAVFLGLAGLSVLLGRRR